MLWIFDNLLYLKGSFAECGGYSCMQRTHWLCLHCLLKCCFSADIHVQWEIILKYKAEHVVLKTLQNGLNQYTTTLTCNASVPSSNNASNKASIAGTCTSPPLNGDANRVGSQAFLANRTSTSCVEKKNQKWDDVVLWNSVTFYCLDTARTTFEQ